MALYLILTVEYQVTEQNTAATFMYIMTMEAVYSSETS
jgi:hypothetical protein